MKGTIPDEGNNMGYSFLKEFIPIPKWDLGFAKKWILYFCDDDSSERWKLYDYVGLDIKAKAGPIY